MRFGKLWLSSFALVMLSAAGIAAAQEDLVPLAGRWQGQYTPKADKGQAGAARSRELGSGRADVKKPIVTVLIGAGADGKITGTWTQSGQRGPAAPMAIAMDGEVVRFSTSGPFAASWEGKLSADGSTLDGMWHGKGFGGDQAAPLVLKRTSQ